MALLTAIKALQYRPSLILGNPRAAVVHFNTQARGIAARSQQHLACGRGELDCIAKQVGQCFEQQFAVTVQGR
ncbi:hypothetical protein D3C72_2264790 [compost metagenome]